MCLANNEERKKTKMEGTEPPNKERIRTLGEKENYMYLGILKGKRESFSKSHYVVGISPKRIITWVISLVRYSEPFLK